MKNLITEARELCADATPGQWKRHDTADYAEIHNGDTWGKALSPIALVGYTEDADFIARSRTLIPELCDALEKAELDADTIKRLYETACVERNMVCADKALNEAKHRWIPVTERLPTERGYYLSVVKRTAPTETVTHWMPLPAAPEKGAEHERD